MSIPQAVKEVARAVIQAIAAANGDISTRQSMGLRVGRPMMKQVTFNLDKEDKYP